MNLQRKGVTKLGAPAENKCQPPSSFGLVLKSLSSCYNSTFEQNLPRKSSRVCKKDELDPKFWQVYRTELHWKSNPGPHLRCKRPTKSLRKGHDSVRGEGDYKDRLGKDCSSEDPLYSLLKMHPVTADEHPSHQKAALKSTPPTLTRRLLYTQSRSSFT